MVNGLRVGASYFLGFGLISLAAALVFFTLELAMYRQNIPSFLEKVESTSNKIEPVVIEVGEIRAILPDILQEIEQSRALVTPILNEVTAYRKQIPIILEEVRSTRQHVPLLINEIKEVRKQIPDILKSTNKATDAVVMTANEIKATRPLVLKMLDEIKKTREIIPPTLDRVDNMIASAKKAGKEASKGVVTGVLTGIITSPFTILGKIGDETLGFDDKDRSKLTDNDVEFIKGIVDQLLAVNKEGSSQAWANTASGHKGNVTLESIDMDNGQECRTFLFDVWKEKKTIVKKSITTCQSEDGTWERLTK